MTGQGDLLPFVTANGNSYGGFGSHITGRILFTDLRVLSSPSLQSISYINVRSLRFHLHSHGARTFRDFHVISGLRPDTKLRSACYTTPRLTMYTRLRSQTGLGMKSEQTACTTLLPPSGAFSNKAHIRRGRALLEAWIRHTIVSQR